MVCESSSTRKSAKKIANQQKVRFSGFYSCLFKTVRISAFPAAGNTPSNKKMILQPRFFSALVPFIVAAFPQASEAATLTNGSLTINIRSNGAIDSATFGGSDYFNPGASVSDWGLQRGTDTGSFVRNTTDGFTQQAVTVSNPSGFVVAGGTYTQAGSDVAFTRSYSLVAGLNVLRVDTVFQNNGSDLTLRYFDTFDPDQGFDLGMGFETYNDVFSLGGSLVGQARIQGANSHTVIAGSSDSRAVIAAGFPFAIFSGDELNSFFNSPFDGNDAFADEGLHIGFETMLASGSSDSFTYFLAFGLSPEDAQTDFLATSSDSSDTSAIPEPASVIGLGVLLGAGLLLRRRKG